MNKKWIPNILLHIPLPPPVMTATKPLTENNLGDLRFSMANLFPSNNYRSGLKKKDFFPEARWHFS